MLEVRGLTYDYPGCRALKDVSFDIGEGTITSVVGPNGAGKTTLLRCLAALARPLSGTVRVGGFDTVEDPRACHSFTGFVADFYGLYDTMRVGDYLAFFAHARLKSDDARERASALAKRVGLDHKFNEPIRGLSRGMRQRLAVAQAVIHAPKLLLLDEPASGLDPEARHNLAILLKELRQEGMTIIVSSHILAELDAYSTDVLMMHLGEVIEQKSLSEALSGRQTIRIVQHPSDDFAIFTELDSVVGVADVSHDDTAVFCTIPEGPEARADLLRHLVGARVPVIEFGPVGRSLEREYLNRMRKVEHRGAADD